MIAKTVSQAGAAAETSLAPLQQAAAPKLRPAENPALGWLPWLGSR